MSLRKLVLSVSAAVGLAVATPVLAQPKNPTPPTFTVSNITGEVLVLRGNTVYKLANGDILALGDKVFTRSNAQATVNQLGDCSLSLPAANSVTIPSTGNACWLNESQIAALNSSTTIGGTTIGTGVTTGTAAPVITALAAVGVGAAVSRQSGSP